ncbi:hypothetical protein RSOL_457880, partial [Rhizoctonia solani AG-3 Rhs1AP]
MSSLPKNDHLTIGTVVINEADGSKNHLPRARSPQGAHRSWADLLKRNAGTRPALNNSLPFRSSAIMPTEDENQGHGRPIEFNRRSESVDNTPPQADLRSNLPPPDHVREYLVIEAEFDITPTICHLGQSVPNVMKTVISKPIHVVRYGNPITEAIEKALRSPSGCLIFCDMFISLPPGLSNQAFDLVIHLGWPKNDGIYRDHAQLPPLQTHLILLSRKEVTGSDGSLLLSQLRGLGVSAIDPNTKRNFNRQTELSTIALERNLWREALASVSSAAYVRSYYMAWITHHFSGIYKQQDWTAIDVVTNANKHVKEVLLHGYGRQGNPVRGRPTVTAGYVAHFKLEEAVMAGILTVRS